MKKLFVFFAISIILFSLIFVIAQEDTSTTTSATDTTTTQPETSTALEFNKDPGLTPNNGLYFIDNFIERISVGDDPEKALDAREEKIAEAIVMVETGKTQEAQQVLEKALEYGDIVEKEASPEMRKKIEESTQQVQNVLEDLKEQAESQNMNLGDNFDENIAKEKKIRTAAEIAAKINELCAELAQLDPIQYEDTCKIDNAPKWMQDRHKEWTKEQEKEAKEFGEIIGECFKTSGRECRCEDISFNDFSIFCEKMSSLSVKCDEGDKNSCIEMQSVEMPELPEHLKDVFYKIESGVGETKFEKHMPQECIDAKATNPKECMLIMIEFNAPPECRTALKEAAEKGQIRGEIDGKKLCDEIMFKQHTPQECIDKGITTANECAKIMFKTNMPQECINAGFDGTHKGDEKECKELMKKGEYYGGASCLGIGDVEERLRCLEGAVTVIQDRYANEEVRGQITWQCKENRIHWPPDCERFMREEWPRMEQQNQVEIQKTVEQRQIYNEYRVQGGQLCPDRICDNAEKTGLAYCPQDCGDIYSSRQQCGYNCWWEVDHCECKAQVSGQECGYGCWWNSGLNKCECQATQQQQCGYNCWWKVDHCECGVLEPARQDCSYGCWWDSGMNACKCAPTTTNCGSGCWWNSGLNKCECSTGGCTNWASTGQGCNPSTGTCCSSGTCSNPSGPGSCVTASTTDPCPSDSCPNVCCGATTTCSVNSFTTNTGSCNYGTCPNGCNMINGCPTGCMSYAGYCGDHVCSSSETSTSCPGDCGTVSGGCTNWASTGQGCNPSTGTCCSSGTCSNPSGPGSCVASTTGTSCVDNTWTTNAGACDYSVCPNGCNMINGCPTGCMSYAGYCGDHVCSSSETSTSCPGDCGTVSGGCTSSFCGPGYYCGASGTCIPESTTTPSGTTCSSKGGTCCNVCAGGSYISGTECNCCGTCSTTTEPTTTEPTTTEPTPSTTPSTTTETPTTEPTTTEPSPTTGSAIFWNYYYS